MSIRSSMMARLQQMQQEQQQRHATALETARTQPIPGFTGPTSTGQIPGVGMAPPQMPPMPGTAHPSMASGPYGQQAMQLAGVRPTMFAPGQMPHGVLGDGGNELRDAFLQRFPNRGGLLGRFFGTSGQAPDQGLLGAPPKGFRVPFYRPPGK
jgi:hypothetical protein